MYESKVKYYYGTGRRKHSSFVSPSLLLIISISSTSFALLQAAVLQVRQALSDTVSQELSSNSTPSFVPSSRRLDSSLVTRE